MAESTGGPRDREAASKARKRRRILDAAAALLTAGAEFSVDEVAARAGLSRRTIFNYFPSTDDLIIEVGTQMLGGLVDSLPVSAAQVAGNLVGDDLRRALFAEVSGALYAADLVPAMVRLTQVLGGVRRGHPRVAASVQAAFLRMIGRLVREVGRRYPDADPLDLELLASCLVSGLIVLYQHWSARHGVRDTPQSRQAWSELLDRLVLVVGHGFLAAPAPDTPAPATPYVPAPATP